MARVCWTSTPPANARGHPFEKVEKVRPRTGSVSWAPPLPLKTSHDERGAPAFSVHTPTGWDRASPPPCSRGWGEIRGCLPSFFHFPTFPCLDARAFPHRPQGPSLTLGLDGFEFADLYQATGLRRLSERFDAELAGEDPALATAFSEYRRTQGQGLSKPAESDLLIRVSRHGSRFVARLFASRTKQEALVPALRGELPLFDFKREFITRRVFKKGAPDRPTPPSSPRSTRGCGCCSQLGFPEAADTGDVERGLAESVLTLLELERLFAGNLPAERRSRAPSHCARAGQALRAALLVHPGGQRGLRLQPGPKGDDAAELRRCARCSRWPTAGPTRARCTRRPSTLFHGWATHRLPKPLVFDSWWS